MTVDRRFPRIPVDEASIRELYVRLAAGEVLVLIPNHLSAADIRTACEHARPIRVDVTGRRPAERL